MCMYQQQQPRPRQWQHHQIQHINLIAHGLRFLLLALFLDGRASVAIRRKRKNVCVCVFCNQVMKTMTLSD